MKTTIFPVFLLSIFSLSLFADTPKIPPALRDQYLERSQVWKPTPVPINKMRTLEGPKSRVAAPPRATVTCTYVEPKEPPGGTTPKFKCTLRSGDVIRVKYDTPEVYAEIAGTRFLWALGFYADNDYLVKIRCLKCPEKDPWKPEKNEARITRMIPDVMIEENFPGDIIEQSPDQGWNWSELSKVKSELGGATPVQIDAFKLMAVLIQHSDNKAVNQRLACYKSDMVINKGVAECHRPVLMIADLGATFGTTIGFITAGAKMDFENWKKTDIWNSAKEHDFMVQHNQQICIGNLANTHRAGEEGLFDPPISEEGRKFLADLLNQLTVKQIRDVFTAAGVNRMGQTIEENGVRRKVTVQDWTDAFVKKRQQINERKCPSPTNPQ